jgi:hypothetical protein
MEALGHVRETAEGSRTIEGIAVPYGVVSNETLDPVTGAVIREALAPHALRESVSGWMSRQDGARMAYRPAHGEKPVGTVSFLESTPEGVAFRADIREGPRGDEYLDDVRSGLNGVSIEYLPDAKTSRRMKDGTYLHRSGRLAAIAGSVSPAFDGARIALRDMEDTTVSEEVVETITEPVAAPERVAAERSAVAGFSTGAGAVVTRPEAVYGPQSEHNHFRDGWLAERGDSAARERRERHERHLYDVALAMERDAAARIMAPIVSERAGDLLSSEIPGAYPNDYLPGLLTPRILKGRPMGDFYQRFPIADARPRIFAKVTTSSTVAVQSAEGAALSVTDIATTAVTANPLMYGATIDVSRQVLDGADPSALAMVYQDLIEAYAQASETVIKTAVEAGSTASGVAITAATPYAGTLANVVNYFGTRFRGATGAFIPSALFSVLAAQGDTTGRPFLPMIGAVNSDGATLADDLSLELAVLTARAKLSYASTVNVCVFGRPNDFVIYESPIAQFSYDQVVGPQAVRVGLWAYLVVGTRLGSLKVTAA